MAMQDEDDLEVAHGTTEEQARAHKDAKNRTQARLALRSMGGPQKAAVILMAIGEERAGKMFQKMDDEEIKEISSAMATLGSIGAPIVEELFRDFVNAFSGGGSLVGSFEGT